MKESTLLEKDSYIPLHVPLKDNIEQQILNGNYEGRIPSEREWMKQYDLS